MNLYVMQSIAVPLLSRVVQHSAVAVQLFVRLKVKYNAGHRFCDTCSPKASTMPLHCEYRRKQCAQKVRIYVMQSESAAEVSQMS